MTDGNTYAINKHLDEREDYDALQEVTAELEQAEADNIMLIGRIEELEAKLAEAERSLDISCVIIDKLMEDEDMSDDLMKRLDSLHKQATVERSHFYVGSCAKDAMHRIEELEAKLVKAVGDLQSMPEAVVHTTLDDGPLWPEDRTGVWLAALHACKNVVQSKVDQTLAELKGQE